RLERNDGAGSAGVSVTHGLSPDVCVMTSASWFALCLPVICKTRAMPCDRCFASPESGVLTRLSTRLLQNGTPGVAKLNAPSPEHPMQPHVRTQGAWHDFRNPSRSS